MTRKDVENELIHCLTEIQTQSGRPMPQLLDTMIPFRDMEDFDSLNAEEVCAMMEGSLKMKIGHHKDVFSDGRRLLSLREMVDYLCAQHNIGG